MPYVLFDDMQFVIYKQDPCLEMINMDLTSINSDVLAQQQYMRCRQNVEENKD
jgi:hypothetical protein